MKKLYIETYGCQMNVADSEVVASVMKMAGYEPTDNEAEADAVFLNTCSVRENAENKIYQRLDQLYAIKEKREKERVKNQTEVKNEELRVKNQNDSSLLTPHSSLNTPHSTLNTQHSTLILGVLGCMAERVKDDLVKNHHANIVCGPDAYMSLPEMMAAAEQGLPAVDVELSTTETYRNVLPTRIGGNHVSGFVSIMRGCNNFCHYCIVPYTRGRERSRDVESILAEVRDLHDRGFKEVTLLGQNVNSYGIVEEKREKLRVKNQTEEKSEKLRVKNQDDSSLITISSSLHHVCSFAELLRKVAEAVPDMRVRFTTSNPEDMTEDILHAIADEPNLCNHIHFPAQSGSSKVLHDMNRKYTREEYLAKVEAIRRIIPDCGLTTDIFVGYHDETEEDFQQTLSLMKEVRFDAAFMFKYSERPGTYAAKHLPDNVPEEEKIRRLNELIHLQTQISAERNKEDEGKEFEILIERFAKRSRNQLMGRTQQNKAVIIPKGNHHIGDTVRVRITSSTSATLMGEPVE